MRAAVLIVLALALYGCTSTPEVRTITHEIFVPVPCDPPLPERPASAVDALPLTAPIDEQMRALRADRARTRPYVNQLEAALASCR